MAAARDRSWGAVEVGFEAGTRLMGRAEGLRLGYNGSFIELFSFSAKLSLRRPRLVKYVKKRYPTVRVGTLLPFRVMEGAQADALDGLAAGLEFRGPSRTMYSDDYNRMMHGSNL